MPPPVVLVTGASSGIGRACADHLTEHGYRVYAASRTSDFRLDVTVQSSVDYAIQSVLDREGRLDIVVNNAGIAVAGPVETTPIEEACRLFDVNFFGALRVIRAALPAMRAQRSGYIVNIGSIGGLIAIPYQSLYSASKFALEGLTESLRLEVRPFGIQVVLIEPGDHCTPLTQNRTVVDTSADYTDSFHNALTRMSADEQSGPAPAAVAKLLHRILTTPSPRLRYTTGPVPQRTAVWLKRLLPNAFLESAMRQYYGLH
jgi:NAD(P)-dependent dehydrogenase (short-subunit alcohol dehydrogenase family)